MAKDTILISEIFGPTIQGEGALTGKPTVFVRTGGCDYRCSWCDTLYAVENKYRHDWKPTSAADIFTKIQGLSQNEPIMVTLSGGNPAIQPFKPLIDMGQAQGYQFNLETQGSIAQDWFSDLDVLTLSPKPPSSGMDTDWNALSNCISAAKGVKTILKIVVMDEGDYAYARDVSAKHPTLPIYLQPANHTPPTENDDRIDIAGIMERTRWLVDRVMQDQWYDANVLPQLHTLIWGNERGV